MRNWEGCVSWYATMIFCIAYVSFPSCRIPYNRFYFLKVYLVYNYVFMCGYLHMRQVPEEVRGIPTELELQADVIYLTWVLGKELRSSAREGRALNHLLVSIASQWNLLLKSAFPFGVQILLQTSDLLQVSQTEEWTIIQHKSCTGKLQISEGSVEQCLLEGQRDWQLTYLGDSLV